MPEPCDPCGSHTQPTGNDGCAPLVEAHAVAKESLSGRTGQLADNPLKGGVCPSGRVSDVSGQMSGHDATLRSISAQRLVPSVPGTVTKLLVPRLSDFSIEFSFAPRSLASCAVVRGPRFRASLIRCQRGTLPANCSSSGTLVCVMVVLVASNDSDRPMGDAGGRCSSSC